MKALALSLGLAVTAVAQAVTTPWTSYGDTWAEKETIKEVSVGNTGSVACVVTIKALPTDLWDALFLRTSTLGHTGSLAVMKDATLEYSNTTWASGLKVGDTFVVAFNLVNTTTDLLFNYSYNGAEFAEAFTREQYDKNSLSVLAGKSSEALANYVDVAFYTMDREATAAEVLALLPEPGVLALLALGIAGVALKRKAA